MNIVDDALRLLCMPIYKYLKQFFRNIVFRSLDRVSSTRNLMVIDRKEMSIVILT